VGIARNGTLWTWGRNNEGQLGDGTTTLSLSPVQVPGAGWIAVTASRFSSGSRFSVGIRETEGTRELFSWGSNTAGRLGNGTTAGSMANRSPQNVTVSGGNWIAVASGRAYTLAIRETEGKREVWGWGAQANGELGDGTRTQRNSPVPIPGDNWASVSAGEAFSLGMREINGKRALWTWGSNSAGQIGDGTPTRRPDPTLVIGR